jgi:hypothetical protein
MNAKTTKQLDLSGAERTQVYVPIIDRLLPSGIRKKGLYGIVGPSGVGKSTLALMIASDGVTCGTRGAQFDSISEFKFGKKWCFFSHQDTDKRLRLLSYAAQIPRLDIENRVWQHPDSVRSVAGLTQPQVMSRKKKIEQIMNDNLYTNRDSGDVHVNPFEIEKRCLEIQNRFGRVDGVVIDGLLDCCSYLEDSMSTTKASACRYSDFCTELMEYFRNIAEIFSCPVWITCQMSGSASSQKPAYPFSHKHAARFSAFGEYVDGCLVMGVPSDQSFVFSIKCTKAQCGLLNPNQILARHDPTCTGVIEANNYVEDRYRKNWVLKNSVRNEMFLKVEKQLEGFRSEDRLDVRDSLEKDCFASLENGISSD